MTFEMSVVQLYCFTFPSLRNYPEMIVREMVRTGISTEAHREDSNSKVDNSRRTGVRRDTKKSGGDGAGVCEVTGEFMDTVPRMGPQAEPLTMNCTTEDNQRSRTARWWWNRWILCSDVVPDAASQTMTDCEKLHQH